MSKKSWHLGRRMFLGGAAATVALPYLEAMVPGTRMMGSHAAKAGAETPVRLVWVHVPNGMIRTKIKPAAEGRGYAMPELVRGIEDMRDHFSILTGISNKPGGGSYTYPDGTRSDDGPGDHARDVGTFLTAARLRKTDGDDIQNGISCDQVAANTLREFTPEIPSLELATRGGSYGGDSGYSPVYQSAISWINATTPNSKETSPRAVFERLFAGFDTTATQAEIERRQRLEQSVLDYCMEDKAQLERLVGARDRIKLDEYFTTIRQLEVRLNASGGALACDPGAAPPDTGDFLEKTELFYDVMALAFQCDRTRVITLMLQKENSVYDFLTVGGNRISGNHHGISHLDSGASDVAQIEEINRWQIESFGSLIRKLQAVTDGTGATLLDNSLVLFGGGLDGTGHNSSDPTLTPQQSGGVHRHTDLPLFLGGRGGGVHDSGRHIVFNDDEPIADLYIAMLNAAGVPATTFGIEGTRPLDLA
jgi:hypothetical protein